jgi:hypothetical protein
MAHHSIGDVGDGTLGSWGVPEAAWGQSRPRSSGAGEMALEELFVPCELDL